MICLVGGLYLNRCTVDPADYGVLIDDFEN